MIKKNLINFFPLLFSSVILGCASPNSSYNGGYTASYQQPTRQSKPKFIGWDENGFKKFEGSTSELKNKYNNFIIEASNTKKTILNEDAIICESESPLIPSVAEGTFVGTVFSGTILTAAANMVVKMNEIDKIGLSANQNYLNEINSIPGSNRVNGINYQSIARDGVSSSVIALNENEGKVKHAANFLRLCKSTEGPQFVDILENKPISKVAKIRVKLNNKPYDLWTYENHLTIKD